MLSSNMVNKRLGDVVRFESKTTSLHKSIDTVSASFVRTHVFEDALHVLTERISQLERTHAEEIKSLTSRCDRLEKMLRSKKEAVPTGETTQRLKESERNTKGKRKEDGQTALLEDTDLTLLFDGKDLEVMTKGVDALKTWTKKDHATVVYDSVVDDFTAEGLFDAVKETPNIALVGFTADGDVFGGFFKHSVRRQGGFNFGAGIFAFSFESHGRCMAPQRFVVKEEWKEWASVRFNENSRYGFVHFEVRGSCFLLGNEESHTFCENMSQGFECIQDTTLVGTSGNYRCTRIIAFHLFK